MANFESPIPLSEIESVLAWVDTFKLSRPTKKINRDFSDAVLLAEILNVNYPKLVEMHNYPPRNSHSLKLNNWLTLNRKVLKKLKLNLCINTMEQLANSNNGVIERVLVMVRDKIRRDEDLNRSMKDHEQNMSSGGSFYEACGEEDNVLIVPVKVRVNGVLESVQQKVVNYEAYLALKEELKDAKDSSELLKQKVEHLDSLLKLKDERIDELQKQLDRKQARRKEADAFQNSLQVPFETVPSPVPQTLSVDALSGPVSIIPMNPPPMPTFPMVSSGTTPIISTLNPIVTKSAESVKFIKEEPIKMFQKEESKIPMKLDSTVSMKHSIISKNSLSDVSGKDLTKEVVENAINLGTSKLSYTKIPAKISHENKLITYVETNDYIEVDEDIEVDRIKSDVFKEVEIIDDKNPLEFDEFQDSQQENLTTIEESIQKEIKNIANPIPIDYIQKLNC